MEQLYLGGGEALLEGGEALLEGGGDRPRLAASTGLQNKKVTY